MVNTWDQLGKAGYDWWTRISRVEHFGSLQQITGTLVGTVGTLPTVAEGAEYTELTIGDSPETADFVKYGGYIPLTLELIDRDETRKLAAYPRELAAAGLRKISALVAAIFSANSGIGPTMADTGALFNATAVTTAGGHKNLLTTALAAAEWDVVSKAVYDQPMLIKNAAGVYGTGPKMAINPRFCVVPRALQLTAMKILYPSLENATSIYSENHAARSAWGCGHSSRMDGCHRLGCCLRSAHCALDLCRRALRHHAGNFHCRRQPQPCGVHERRTPPQGAPLPGVWVNDFRPLHKINVGELDLNKDKSINHGLGGRPQKLRPPTPRRSKKLWVMYTTHT